LALILYVRNEPTRSKPGNRTQYYRMDV
jgi:hypothetical protein